jgi:hypothetical protein
MENLLPGGLPLEKFRYEYIGPDTALTAFLRFNRVPKYLSVAQEGLLSVPQGSVYLELDFVPDDDEHGVRTDMRSIMRYCYLCAAGLDGVCDELTGNPLLSEVNVVLASTNRRMARFAMDTAGFDCCFFDFDVAKEPNIDVLKAKMLEQEEGIRIGTTRQNFLQLQPRFRELSQKLSGRVNGTE